MFSPLSTVVASRMSGCASCALSRSFSARVVHSSVWKSLSYLRSPGRDVYLLGTAHISEKSVSEVRRLARNVQPDIIFTELCEKRARKLRAKSTVEHFGARDALQAVLSGGMSLPEAFFKTIMRSLQSRSAGSIGLKPGGELLAAIEVAEELGVQVVYGDRDVDETLRKLREAVWAELGSLLSMQPGDSVRHALQSGGGPVDTVERLRVREVVSDLRRTLDEQAPQTARVIMHERDEIMASSLIDLSASGSRVLAVVGAAHMEGIEQRWLERVLAPQ